MFFKEGQQIGRYTLIKWLGKGGFGEVWLAENHNNPLSEKVAIKLPRKEQIDLQAIKEEIFNWALAGKHKNILPFIECETFDNQVAIVSEYARDGSLQGLLEKKGVFSVTEAVEIGIGILEGLAHLHYKKVIHRDLKPDNVLFQNKTPRLSDFGISRVLPIDSQSKTVSGTLAYMALECFDGKRNEQTDFFSCKKRLEDPFLSFTAHAGSGVCYFDLRVFAGFDEFVVKTEGSISINDTSFNKDLTAVRHCVPRIGGEI